MNHHKDMNSLEPRWPEDGLEPVRVCPVCGESGRETLYEGLTDRLFGAPGEWTLRHCLGCRSAYLDPRPTTETIGLAYRSYYTHESQGVQATPRYFTYDSPAENAALKPKRGLAGVKTWLRFGYLNNRYNLNLQPASPLGRWIVPWFPTRRSDIDRWMRNLALPHPGARLLDVGCGNGAFLRLASHIGWQAQGLEPDPTAAAAARSTGLQIEEGHLPDTGLPSGYFEAVTLSHVIEHLHDPGRSLRELYRILAPGGRLWIATPNLDSPLHRLFRRNWRGLEPPRHLVLFNMRSLTSACRRVGFEPVTVCKPPHSAQLITIASRSIQRGEESPGCAPSKLTLADRIRALGLDWGAVIRPEWGQELVVLATKPAE